MQDNDFRTGPMTAQQREREVGLKPYRPGDALVNGRPANAPPPISLPFGPQPANLAVTQVSELAQLILLHPLAFLSELKNLRSAFKGAKLHLA